MLKLISSGVYNSFHLKREIILKGLVVLLALLLLHKSIKLIYPTVYKRKLTLLEHLSSHHGNVFFIFSLVSFLRVVFKDT